jgi:hypothetical protein
MTGPTLFGEPIRKIMVNLLAALVIASGSVIASLINSPKVTIQPASVQPAAQNPQQTIAATPPADLQSLRYVYGFNLGFAAVFLVVWIVGSKGRKQLPLFHTMWLLFWIGLVAYYT